MLLFAPILQNPSQAPVQNAAVWVLGEDIRYAGSRKDLPTAAFNDPDRYEIRDCALIPGLVNAHCHLELTSLAGLSYPGNFVDWIRKILAVKNTIGMEEQTASLTKGILRCLLGGATTVADHISVNGDLETLLKSPFRGKVFIEILGVVPQVGRDLLNAALSLRRAFSDKASLLKIIPSPHSVHALEPEVLEEALSQQGDLFSLHLAESAAEEEYFQTGSGALCDLIAERGNQLRRGASSSIFELNERGLLDGRILAVHGNYLNHEEIKLLARKKISVVHCPLSHRYFGHRPFPLQEALAAGINVALGTDSLASAASLSMLEVLRQVRNNFPDLSYEDIFKIATMGGAKALKLEKEIGEIIPGKKADIVGIPLAGKSSPLDALFSAEQVGFSMINGVIRVR